MMIVNTSDETTPLQNKFYLFRGCEVYTSNLLNAARTSLANELVLSMGTQIEDYIEDYNETPMLNEFVQSRSCANLLGETTEFEVVCASTLPVTVSTLDQNDTPITLSPDIKGFQFTVTLRVYNRIDAAFASIVSKHVVYLNDSTHSAMELILDAFDDMVNRLIFSRFKEISEDVAKCLMKDKPPVRYSSKCNTCKLSCAAKTYDKASPEVNRYVCNQCNGAYDGTRYINSETNEILCPRCMIVQLREKYGMMVTTCPCCPETEIISEISRYLNTHKFNFITEIK